MTFRVRFTREAEEDLVRLCEFILDRNLTDWALAERALETIRHAITGLEQSPFSYRKASGGGSPFLRELVIPFGSAGYVPLFEIEGGDVVTILATSPARGRLPVGPKDRFDATHVPWTVPDGPNGSVDIFPDSRGPYDAIG